ncbi:COX aromatic rich motif-containing protein [Tropicimonas sp. IMCC34011]|uniref:COX aromatic rich motif-containing protein n=1 Tax=Tropicimonas sp. IMCC34011 TaxID=2248759 RepID=UPI000E23BA3C|nr:COX aromatic rich motif-containing protein [Tropicimonas sp. IMCC34011]
MPPRRTVAALAAIGLPGLAEAAGALSPNGPVAEAQLGILLTALGLMAIVVLPVWLLAAVFVLRYRSTAGQTYRPEEDFDLKVDLVIWAVPALIVIAIGTIVWTRTHQLDPYAQIAPGDSLRIEAVALDWKWLFIYPDLGIATVNELALPAGTNAEIALTSDTVINSLIVPGLAGQIMAMAGMRTELNVVADAPALMWGRNTQYSGEGFADQEFRVPVTTPEDFAAWAETARRERPLDRAAYCNLATEGATSEPRRYSAPEGGLFKAIMMQYMDQDRGRLCSDD